ncbi:hypothetical protein Tco_0081840, partial [Tanacetum coccineum]
LIYKVLGLQVSLLELDRFEILLDKREEGQDMRFSQVLLWSPPMIKVSPLMGIWTTFSSQMILAGYLEGWFNKITSSGWPFVSAVLGQIAHLVTSITLNNARSCVMQSVFLTRGTVSNIPIVFYWSDSIRPEGFLSSVLLWLVIIVAVVGVGVMVVVVVGSSSVVKLSFVIT